MVSRKDQIVDTIKAAKSINVTDLVSKIAAKDIEVGKKPLDISNVGRYLKALEKEEKINIEIVQDGKKRFKILTIKEITTRKEIPTTRKKIDEPSLVTPGEKEKKPKKPKSEITTRKIDTSKTVKTFNPSIELNSIKSIFANRWGTSTGQLKKPMVKAIIEAWRSE